MKKRALFNIILKRAIPANTLERAIPAIIMALAIFLAASPADAGGRDRNPTRDQAIGSGGVVSGALVAEGVRIGYGGGNLRVSIGGRPDRHGRYRSRSGFRHRGWHRRAHGGYWRIEKVWVPATFKGPGRAKHDRRCRIRGHRHGGKRSGFGRRGHWSQRRVWVSY